MLSTCLSIIAWCFIGSVTTVICVYILIYATSWVLALLYDFLFGGEEYEE